MSGLLRNLEQVNVGFRTTGLFVFGLSPQTQGMGDEQMIVFYRGLTEKLRALPQVESVTLLGNRIASGWSNNTDVFVDGRIPRGVRNPLLR